MKQIMIWVTGFFSLLMSLLFRTLLHSDVFGRVPNYIGPPVDPSVLHVMQMWQFPYILNTFSDIAFIVGVELIITGIYFNFGRQIKDRLSVDRR